MITDEIFSRAERLIGSAAMKKLAKSRVAVFGVGGVGSFAAEAIVRAGVGDVTIVDFDTVELSNINRQILATLPVVGQKKVAVMKERLLSVNPAVKITTVDEFYAPEKAAKFFPVDYDYVLDAIDNVPGKISLAVECERRRIPIIAAMGAGNKLDPTRFRVTDIYKTSVDPLARIMRKKLKELGIKKLKVVFSDETPRKVSDTAAEGKNPPGSISFVPSVAGLVMAGAAINDLISK